MARLDAFIERLAASSDAAAVPDVARRGPVGRRRRPARAHPPGALPRRRSSELAQIVPSMAGFPRPGTTVFPYASPAGTMEVLFEAHGDEVRAVVRPVSADAPPAPRSSPPASRPGTPAPGVEAAAAPVESSAADPTADAAATPDASSRAVPLPPTRARPWTASSPRSWPGRPPSDLHLLERQPSLLPHRRRHRPGLGAGHPRRRPAGVHALDPRAAQEPGRVRGALRHRLRPRHRRGALPLQRLRRPARDRRGDDNPGQDPDRRGDGAPPAPSSRTSASSRRGSCSSPAPPGRASRRRSRRWSTTSTATATTTSSPSRDPVEFVHENKRSSSTSARSARTPSRSRRRCARLCAKTPTSSWSARCRDLETVAIAIETAETGHLVFGTLHTNSAAVHRRPHHRPVPVGSRSRRSAPCSPSR